MVALASCAKSALSAVVASLMLNPPLQTISEFDTSRNACTARFCDSRNSINRSDSTCRNAFRPDTAPMSPMTATPRMLDSNIMTRILDCRPNRKRLSTGGRARLTVRRVAPVGGLSSAA